VSLSATRSFSASVLSASLDRYKRTLWIVAMETTLYFQNTYKLVLYDIMNQNILREISMRDHVIMSLEFDSENRQLLALALNRLSSAMEFVSVNETGSVTILIASLPDIETVQMGISTLHAKTNMFYAV
jgi:hypothetical protein